MVIRVGGLISGAMASPVMRRSVPIFIGFRAATRSVVLSVAGEAEYVL